MGCNFYTLKGKHIGKRSAAGMFCWDCKITLCKRGIDGIHDGVSPWHEKCPACGKSKEDEPNFSGSVGRELGFNKEPFARKTGVKSCSSFTWGIEEGELKNIRKVKDEYGHTYTIKEFWEGILAECPVQFTNFIGVDFS